MMRILVLLSLLLVPQSGWAQGKASSSDQKSAAVKLRMWTVHATNEHSKTDDKLKRIGKHLRRLKYSGFNYVDAQGGMVRRNGKIEMPIPGRRFVQLTLLSKTAEKAKVRVRIEGKKKTILDTTVSIRRNGFFMVAGPKYDGGVLVLPIFARY